MVMEVAWGLVEAEMGEALVGRVVPVVGEEAWVAGEAAVGEEGEAAGTTSGRRGLRQRMTRVDRCIGRMLRKDRRIRARVQM
jgi:hypothetical protein